MPTRIKQMADIKNKILSKILKVDPKSLKSAEASKRSQSSSSGMDTRVIRNIQNRINNPLFNLTIVDYELMCGNKMITKMMAKVLECDEKQLKKFCKYINVFKENINSSPKSIKNKMKPKMTLNKLPNDLKTQIVEKYMSLFPTKYVLRELMPLEKINWQWLSQNPNAIDLLKEKMNNEYELGQEVLNKLQYKDKIDWGDLSGNPNAIELLEEKINRENGMSKEYLDNLDPTNKIDWNLLSENPNAIELLKANPKKINWDILSKNPSDKAIELLKANPEKIDWHLLSKNPNSQAIKMLKANLDKINWLLLSANTNPAAIELLKANPKKIDWQWLSQNPNAIELLKANPKEIYWNELSENTNAIELLKANQDEIDWRRLSGNVNPEAIKLIKKRLKYLRKLSDTEYYDLSDSEYLDWEDLSRNPAAIELLEEKINEEKNMPELENRYDEISWALLSANPAIFEAK
jgi:hypothetical protein